MNTATMMLRMADNKAKVTGTYYNVPFTGTVTSSRQLYWGPDYPEQITIELDAPINVCQRMAEIILMNSRDVDERTNGMKVESAQQS